MRTEDFKCGVVSILLAFALMFSMMLIAPFASPGDLIYNPGGTTIEVTQGGTFLIRHVLEWNEVQDGAYGVTIAWDCYDNKPEENFTFVEASAYFTTGDHVGESILAEVTWLVVASPDYPGSTRYILSVKCPANKKDPRDGRFNVDITLSASGVGGVPHIPGDHVIPFQSAGIIIVESSMKSWNRDPVTIRVLATGLLPHDPIYIEGNAGFTPENGVNGGGSGTENDPYIIENWDISAENADGIEIRNTTAYFVVRNCVVKNGGFTYRGIYLDSVVNGRIENNTCDNNYRGIWLDNSDNNRIYHNLVENNFWGILLSYYSDNNLISNNLVENNDVGINIGRSSSNLIFNNIVGNYAGGIILNDSNKTRVENNLVENSLYGIYLTNYSDNNFVSNNTCENNGYAGIYLWESDNNLVENNLARNNDYKGIWLDNSDNNLLSNNLVGNNDYGIRLDSSDNNLISNNLMENNFYGICLGSSDNNTTSNNTCENNFSGILLEYSDNNLISNNVTGNNLYNGIRLDYSHNNLVENNTCENNYDDGIELGESGNNLISNNVVKNNVWNGIVLWNSNNNLISNNLMENNYYGIHFAYHSDNNIISNNLVEKNEYGICLSHYGSDNNLIENNRAGNNSTGIFIDGEKNNTVNNNTCENNYYGIYLSRSSNNTLDNNTCRNNSSDGIVLWENSHNNLISNNTCENNARGIYLQYYSDNNLISNNVVKNNPWNGILLWNSFNNLISNNLVENNDYGIYLHNSSYNTLDNNTCENSDRVIYLQYSDNNLISNNTLGNNNDGIYLYDSDNNTLSNNTCENNNYGILVSSSSNNTLTNNTCENNNYGIRLYDSSYNTLDNNAWSNNNGGIRISYSSNNNTLTNNTCENNNSGIGLFGNSDNNTLSNNTCENNNYGIYLSSSGNNTLTNNTCENNNHGIRLYDSSYNTLDNNAWSNNNGGIWISYSSNNNTLTNNTCENNDYGIHLDNSGNNLISNNTVKYNHPGGIYFYYSDNNLIINSIVENNHFGIDSWYSDNNLMINNHVEKNYTGIRLVDSNNNLISNNIVKDNPYDGINLSGSDNNLVENNLVENNYYGIYLNSDNNLIYHNNFVNNATQARDFGTNYWNNDYPSGGNYWSDYTGLDNYQGENQDIPGSDGIGDTPYYIPGDNNRDRYPLMEPWPPEVKKVFWDALIAASFSGGSDDAIFGVRLDATSGFDNFYDIPEAPAPPEPPYVRAYFYYPGKDPDKLHRSCLAPEDLMKWPLRIEYANNIENITLSWSLENVPPDHAVLLFKGGSLVADMRAVDNYTFQATSDDFDFTIRVAVVAAGVDVSISPSYQSGLPGATLSYTVTVTNTGSAADNYALAASDDAGWVDNITLSENLLEVPPGENKTTTLTVTVPENAVPCTEDNVTVTATSQIDNAVSDSASCIAHAVVLVPTVVTRAATRVTTTQATLNADFTVGIYDSIDVWFQYRVQGEDAWIETTPATYTASGSHSDDATGLSPDTTYEFRTCLQYDTENIYGDVLTFTTEAVAPSAPALKSPADGTITNDNTPTFEWTVGSYADNHQLLIDNDPDFTSPIENRLFGRTDNTYTPVLENSLSDNNYSWKVIAINALGENQSSVWTFVIDTVPPAAPSLKSPADGTITDDSTPTFDWSDVTGAENYDLLVDDDADFSSPEIEVTVSVSTYTPTAGLPDNNYSWKVRARDAANNVGDWSSTWTLLIKTIVRRVEVSISPENQSGAPGETLTYTVTVKNEGNISDTYALTAIDSAGWGPTISPSSLTLDAGASGTATLTITIPSDAGDGATDSITVTATSQVDPTVSDSATCIATVIVVRGVRVSISPQSKSGAPGETLTYAITAANTGEAEDTYDLTVDDNAGWGPIISPTSLTVDAGASGTVTLTVTIPRDAENGIEDYITVTATSRSDNTVSDDDSCIAHVAIVRRVEVSISPFENGAEPCNWLEYTVTVRNTGNVDGYFDLSWADTEGWGDNIWLEDNVLWVGRCCGENSTTLHVKIPWCVEGCTWDYITVTATPQDDTNVKGNDTCRAHVDIVRGVDVSISPSEDSGEPGATLTYTITVKNMGNVGDTYDLTLSDNAGWGDNIWLGDNSLWVDRCYGENTATLYIHVPHGVEGCTNDNITVTATSQSDISVSVNDSCIAHVAIVHGVEVSILPEENGAKPCATLKYTVTVTNTGNVDDTYDLTVIDNENWGPTLNNSSLSIPFGESQTTTLSVHIPENAIGCTLDNITVTATGTEVENSASCIAHAEVVRGVEVSISPDYQEGLPGETLTYEVTVKNEGNISDTYDLTAIDTLGWGSTLSKDSLTLAPKAYDTVTLAVHIPHEEIGCTRDNITVMATSPADPAVSVENSCIAHVQVVADVEVSISPESWSAPPGETIIYMVEVTNAGTIKDNYDLVASDTAAPSWNPTLSDLVDNRLENVRAGESKIVVLRVTVPLDALAGDEDTIEVTAYSRVDPTENDSENCTARAIALRRVEVSISPENQSGMPEEGLSYIVTVTNTGNIEDNYYLTVTDSAGWGPSLAKGVLYNIGPSENENVTLSVTIPSGVDPGTEDTIIVTAMSQSNPAVSGFDTCTAYVPVCGVDVTVEPKHQRGTPGTPLTFLVIVHNTGDSVDDYNLWVENDGWPVENIKLENEQLENIQPCENKVTKLHVRIPENAEPCTHKDIVVVVESEFFGATDNDNALIQVVSAYLHAEEPINLEDPVSTRWHELYPNFSKRYHLTSWEDNNDDGKLSPCDQIDMTDNETGEVDNYHVKDVTITILISKNPVQVENTYLDFEGDFENWDNLKKDPVCTQWHEIWPDFSKRYHLMNWDDEGDNDLGPSDQIEMVNKENEDDVYWYHVDEVAIDIVLCKKPRVVHGVEVTVEPGFKEGSPCDNLYYDVIVHNTGTVVDNFILSYIPNGWDNIWIIPEVLENIAPCENKVAMLIVNIPDWAEHCTEKEIVVIAKSEFYDATDNDNIWAHVVVPTCGVDVTIEPKHKRGTPCTWLTFVVRVHNTGNIEDNYLLSIVLDGWPMENINLENNRLENVKPGENKTTNLHIHIPKNAEPCTHKEIVVVAESGFCGATDNDNALIQVVSAYLHAEEPIDLENPVCTYWHELYPNFSKRYHLTSWEDNNDDGKLSPSDQIDMTDNETGEVEGYHVKDVTVTIFISKKPENIENMYLEFEGGFENMEDARTQPEGTQWHEIWPVFSRRFRLEIWKDENDDNILGPSDQILMVDKDTGEMAEYHVNGVATDIVLCKKPPVVPSAPILKSPADGTITNDNKPTFEWTVGSNADNHRLLVDDDPGFTSPIENRLFGPTDNTYTPALENSLPDDNYSWKVIAIRALAENQSSVWTFVIDTVPPAAPSLISPANGAITDDNTPTFGWENVTGAENYDLLVDDDANFSSPKIEVTVSASTYTPTAELPDGSYSWKVMARDAANNVGDWSSTWTLIISVARGVDVYISPSYQSGLPGATLSYSVTVKNEWNISDTFALTVADSAGWVPTLSKDSLALAPKAYDTVTLAVTIPTDASVGDQYNITITAESSVDPTESDSARCTAQATAIRRKVEVSISPESKSGPPWETLTYTVTVVNEGEVEDTYDLTVTDALTWGANVSPTSLTLAAGGSGTATVSVTIPKGTASGTEDEITVTATSRADPSVGDSATCIASAAAVRGVKVSISPENQSGTPEEMLTYTVTVKNEGNVGDTYILSTAGAPDWSPRVENTSLTLNAGRAGETTLTITIPPGASEGDLIAVSVSAISVGDPTVVGSDTCWTNVKGVPEKPLVEFPIPLAISAFLIGAAILSTGSLLHVRSKKAARRRVLRGPRA